MPRSVTKKFNEIPKSKGASRFAASRLARRDFILMIKETELRIGNLIGYLFQRYPDLNKIVTVDSILGNQIQATSGEFVLLEQEAIPIPLTEEWLLKFGFNRKAGREGYAWSLNKFEIGELSNGWFIQFGIDNTLSCYPKYVHQLQNAFFALTGNELTLTPANQAT